MTLLDAPKYDALRARRRAILIWILCGLLVVGGVSTWLLWDWPAEHRVSRFLSAIEARDLQAAFGLWNNDPAWQEHPDRYRDYPFERFEQDWGPLGKSNEFGTIRSHKVVMGKKVGNGIVVGVQINGRPEPIFLRVDSKTGAIGYSPVELYYGP